MLGFDTEYTRRRELVCYQLSNGTESSLYAGSLTVESLYRRVKELTGSTPQDVWLITFWSYAELQFFPVLTKSVQWRLYARGSFDCEFPTKSGAVLHFFDLARFFDGQSLASAAKAFGEKKLEYDVSNVTRSHLRKRSFREYAKHDAYLCYSILKHLRDEFLPLGADPLISKTAASVSATVFRYNYIEDKTRCQDPKARLAGLYACWGGRAEAFKRGRFPEVYEYDIASAYPNAAISIGRFPSGQDLRPSVAVTDKHRGFYRAIFEFPRDCCYPCLPVIMEGCQVYPLKGVSWSTSFEIIRARDLGAKVEILEGYCYDRGSTLLADFMQWALELRKSSTGAKSVAMKLLANSLIGKLAQRRSSIPIEDIRELCERSGVSIHDVIKLTTDELEALGLERITKIGTCFMPEWNTLITGFVRAQLHSLLYEGDPIYCATDSVWSTKPILPVHNVTLKRRGPGIVVRTRLAAIMDIKGPHVVHHSIWNREAAKRLIEQFDIVQHLPYKINRAIKLRESIKRRIRIATFVEELRMGDSSWDQKRKLLPNGDTVPWSDTDEYVRARKEQWGARRR